MGAVVADTGPLRYLVLIDAIGVLPSLFGRVLSPEFVGGELNRPSTPLPVRKWLASAPEWLELRPDPPAPANPPADIDSPMSLQAAA